MKPISEHDEFLLSELLDGNLPDEQSVALRERMTREPELARAYESLARVDQLLAARRGVRPAFDFHRLQEAVMSDVRRRSGWRTALYRFPLWARYAAPLAAAAAISLAVLLNSPAGPQPVSPAHDTVANNTVANNDPSPGQGDDATNAVAPATPEIRVVVQFNRPQPTPQSGRITVAYARSDQQLAEHYRQFDETRRSRPVKRLLFARTPQESGESVGDFLEASPL